MLQAAAERTDADAHGRLMDRLAITCERIARWNSRLRKVRILAEYLRGLPDADLAVPSASYVAARFSRTDRKFSVGGATLREALLQASGGMLETLSLLHPGG